MARAFERTDTRASDVPAATNSREVVGARVLRRTSPEQDRRYHELADKLDAGRLTAEEQHELETLIAEMEQLMLENSRALLRHRDPEAFAATVAEERRVRRWTGQGQRTQRP